MDHKRFEPKNQPSPDLNIRYSGIFFVQFFTPQYFFKCSTLMSGEFHFDEGSVELTTLIESKVITEKIENRKVYSLILKTKVIFWQM